MSHRHDEDRLDRIISQAVDLGHVEFDRRQWLEKAAARRSPSGGSQPQAHRTLWRTIMKSPITKYSVAATILVAVSVVLIGPLASRHNVALAEVAQKLSETRTIIHKETRLAWRQGENEPFFHGEVRKYISTDIGFMEEQYDPNGAVLHRAYFLKEGQVIVVFPQSKRYVTLPSEKRMYEEMLKMSTPAGMVDYFTAMPCTKLGRSQCDGVDVEGFETKAFDFSWLQDYLRYLFPIHDLSARLWVNAETSLPVEIEMKMDVGRGLMNGFQKIHAEFTAYDFQWDVELPEGVLDPNIPADYTQIDLGSMAQENAAWLGVGGVPVGLLVFRRCRKRKSRTAGKVLARLR